MRVFLVCFSFLLFVSTALADPTSVNTDVDGDGLGDIITHDPSTATFRVRESSTLAVNTVNVGSVGDYSAVGDYDGDGVAELASYNPSTAIWSGLGAPINFGSIADYPVPGFYDGLSCMNLATYNQRTGIWTIGDCDGTNPVPFILGGPNHVPVPEDYDCDGKNGPCCF